MSYGIGGAGSVPEAGTFVDPVAGTKILLRRSDTQGKKPAAGDAEYGELFVNYHSNSPMLCFKDNADTIIEIRPLTALELELGELTDVDTTGAINGMVLAYNGSTWVPVTAASLSVDVDLGYTAAADKGIVTNTAGDDAELPLATDALAGLMAPGDKDKLDKYPADPTTNLVDLGYTAAADGGTVTNTGGTDASLPLANGTNAGLTLNNYTTAEKDKLAGIEDGAETNVVTSVHGRTGDVVAAEGDYDLGQMGDVDTTGETSGHVLAYDGSEWKPVSPASLTVDVDLGYTPAADKGTVTNTAGADAEIPLATDALAGLIVDAPSDGQQYARKDGAWDVVAGSATPDLQIVTDEGNTTTNDIITEGDVNADNVVASGDVQATSFNGGPLAGFRNQIINGKFEVLQRGTAFNAGGYTADRWRNASSGGVDVSISGANVPSFACNAYVMTTGGSLQQGVELPLNAAGNATCGPFAIGTQWTFSVWSNKDLTVRNVVARFRDKVGEGTNEVLANSVASDWVQITTDADNGFHRYSATFTIDASPNSTNRCLNMALTGANVLGTVSYTHCQLEPGPVATPFEHRPYGIELALCQRFYQTRSSGAVNAADLRPTMRATPTISGSNYDAEL